MLSVRPAAAGCVPALTPASAPPLFEPCFCRLARILGRLEAVARALYPASSVSHLQHACMFVRASLTAHAADTCRAARAFCRLLLGSLTLRTSVPASTRRAGDETAADGDACPGVSTPSFARPPTRLHAAQHSSPTTKLARKQRAAVRTRRCAHRSLLCQQRRRRRHRLADGCRKPASLRQPATRDAATASATSAAFAQCGRAWRAACAAWCRV